MSPNPRRTWLVLLCAVTMITVGFGPMAATATTTDQAGATEHVDGRPLNAYREHAVFDVLTQEWGYTGPQIAQLLTSDADANGASDLLDLTVDAAAIAGHAEIPVEVLARWDDRPTQTDADAFAARTDAADVTIMQTVDALFATVPADRAHDALDLDGLDLLLFQPRIFAQEHAPHHYSERTPNENVQADIAHADGFTGEDVTIAVLDTGADCRHAAFNDGTQLDTYADCGTHTPHKIKDFVAFEAPNQAPNSDALEHGFDGHDHGTHVASTAAGDDPSTDPPFVGSAPDADLVILRVLDDSGSGTIASFESAVQYIASNKGSLGIDVVSMSAGLGIAGLTSLNGGELDLTAWDGIAAQVPEQMGLPFTIAAGNHINGGFSDVDTAPPAGVNGYNQVGSPGYDPSVITVGSVTTWSNHALTSSIGPGPTGQLASIGGHEEALIKPDVMGHGDRVWAADANTAGGYRLMSGTSMATPGIAGVVALLLDKNPDLTPTEIKDVLTQTGEEAQLSSITQETRPGPNFVNGHGIAQAERSLALVETPVLDIVDVRASSVHQDRILVAWTTSNEVDSVVTYTPEGGSATTVSDDERTTEHTLTLDGLNADTSYTIEVGCSDGTGCPKTADPISVTTLPAGSFPTQDVTLYPRNVFKDGSFTGQAHQMDTLAPSGEEGNQAGTFYIFPGPLGPNSWSFYHAPPGTNQATLDGDLHLDDSQDATAHFTIVPTPLACTLELPSDPTGNETADTLIPDGAQLACPGVVPITVTATLRSGTTVLGTGSTSQTVTDTQLFETEPVTIDVPIDLTEDLALAERNFSVEMEWETPAEVALNEIFLIEHTDEDPISLDLPLVNPVDVGPIDVTESSGTFNIQAPIASPFGSYDLPTDPAQASELKVFDENGIEQTVSASQTGLGTWTWTPANDGISSGEYTLVVAGTNLQGAQAGRATTIQADGTVEPNLPPVLSDPTATPGEVKNDGVETTVLTVQATDSDGFVDTVTADLSALGGSAGTQMVDDGTGADQTASDDVYSLEITVPNSVPTGSHTIPVTATDDAGDTTTDTVSLTVLDGIPPSAVTDLTVTDAHDGRLEIDWSPAIDGESGLSNHEIERKDPGASSFEPLATTSGSSYTDMGLEIGATYEYRVRGVDNEGNTGPWTTASGVSTALPTIDIETPGQGELVSGLFELSGTATLPSTDEAGTPVPETLGSDPAGDTEDTTGTVGTGHVDITDVVAFDAGSQIGFKLMLDELGSGEQAGSTFYAVNFTAGDERFVASSHVIWAAGQPTVDREVAVSQTGATTVWAKPHVNTVEDSVTLLFPKDTIGLGSGGSLSDISSFVAAGAEPGLDGSTVVVGLPTADEASGGSQPWSYTLRSPGQVELAQDPADVNLNVDTVAPWIPDAADMLGVSAWDQGDDAVVRVSFDQLADAVTSHGSIFYVLQFRDGHGDQFHSVVRVEWVAGQPVLVDNNPALVPTKPTNAVYAAADVEIDRMNDEILFGFSKNRYDLGAGLSDLSAHTFLQGPGVIIDADHVPDGAPGLGGTDVASTSLAYVFRDAPGSEIITDPEDDTPPNPANDVFVGEPMDDEVDIVDATVSERGDDVVVRTGYKALGFVDLQNGESVYTVLFEHEGTTYEASARILWVGGQPLPGGPAHQELGEQVGARVSVVPDQGAVTFHIPRTGIGLGPGESLEDVTVETRRSAQGQMDDAGPADHSLLEQVTPAADIEYRLDDGVWQPVSHVGFANGVFSFSQPLDADPMSLGEHALAARITQGPTTVSDDVGFQVILPEDLPVFDPAPPASVQATENIALELDILARHTGGEQLTGLTVDTSDLPSTSTASFPVTLDGDEASGTFRWIPDVGDAGSYDVTFTASDEHHSTTHTVTVDVVENQPPTLEPQPDITVGEGERAYFTLEAEDPEGQPLRYTASTSQLTGAELTLLPLDEASGSTFEDASGHGRDATCTSCPTLGVGGKVGTAVRLDGVDDHLSFDTDPAFDMVRTDAFSLEAWVKTTTTDDGAIIAKMDPDSAFRGYDLFLKDDGTLRAHVINDWGANDAIAVDGATAINDGAWHHVIASYDGSSSADGLKLFVDGTEEPTTVVQDGLTSSIGTTADLQIGARNGTQTLEGTVDNVAVHGRALTADDAELLAGNPDRISQTVPEGASFTDNGDGRASFHWETTFVDAGTYEIDATLSDGTHTVPITVEVTVADLAPGEPNGEPAISAPRTVHTLEGEELTFDVVATDPEGDGVGLSVINAPETAAFTTPGDGTGTFAWTPTFEQAGTYTVEVHANDGEAAGMQEIELVVHDVDRAPVIEPIPDQQLLEMQTLSLQVDASDPEGDAVELSLGPGSPGTLSSQGELVWTPDLRQSGTHTIWVQASDGHSTTQLPVTVEVLDDTPVLELRALEPVVGLQENALLVASVATEMGGEAVPGTEVSGTVTYQTPAGDVGMNEIGPDTTNAFGELLFEAPLDVTLDGTLATNVPGQHSVTVDGTVTAVGGSPVPAGTASASYEVTP